MNQPTTNNTTKKALSAPSAPVSALSADVLLSAGFTAEDLETIEENRFSVGIVRKAEPYFFHVQYGGVIPLSEIRKEYEDLKEDLAEEDDIHSLSEWLDALTDMGGDLCPAEHFFLPVVNGEEMNEQADDTAWFVIDGATDFFAKTGDAVTILSVFSPDYADIEID